MSTSSYPEKRKYVRITDRLCIAVRSIDEAEKIQKLHGATNTEHYSPSIGAQLKKIDDQLTISLHSLGDKVPKTAEVLSLINKKLNIFISHVLKSEISEDHTEQDVSISASGIGFSSQNPIPKDSSVALDIILSLNTYKIIVSATITSCESISENDERSAMPGHTYYIRAEFVSLSEEDEEMLIQYVIRRQSQILKQQRLLKEQQGN